MLIIVMAVVMSLGFDRKFEAWVLDKFPNYGEGLVSIEDTESVSVLSKAKYDLIVRIRAERLLYN